MLVLRYLLVVMNSIQRDLRIEVYNLPMHDVRAIGLKLVGAVGLDMAVAFPKSRSTPIFQCSSTVEVDQQML